MALLSKSLLTYAGEKRFERCAFCAVPCPCARKKNGVRTPLCGRPSADRSNGELPIPGVPDPGRRGFRTGLRGRLRPVLQRVLNAGPRWILPGDSDLAILLPVVLIIKICPMQAGHDLWTDPSPQAAHRQHRDQVGHGVSAKGYMRPEKALEGQSINVGVLDLAVIMLSCLHDVMLPCSHRFMMSLLV